MFFPEDVYRAFSTSEVLPQLLECLPSDKVVAVQFLRGGVVRLTFKDEASLTDVLARGISFQEIQLCVVRAMSEGRVLYVHDLPVEIPDDVVSSFLAAFGDVVHVTRSSYKDFPSVSDGHRVVRIVLKQDVPYFVRIANCNCRVWYSRQPVQCSICRESGHVARNCSLSGRCRRCHQQGHVARLCTQAWVRSSSDTDCDQPVNDEDDGDDSDDLDDSDDPDEDDNNDDNDAPASSSQSPTVPKTPGAPVSLPASVCVIKLLLQHLSPQDCVVYLNLLQD